jgi:predicted DNA-binding protein (MmcQ/YjbR family)
MDKRVLERLRKLCLALPDVSETVTYGHPTFEVSRKTFCVLEEYKGELCIVFKAQLPVQQALIHDARFFMAPYIGKQGWTSLRAATRLDWAEIADLVRDSHALVAPKPKAETKRKVARRRTR